MKILNMYENGNYKVMICDDGTKIRFNNEDSFKPEFPESIDMKITNKCPYACPYCHEKSTPDGVAADLVVTKKGELVENVSDHAIQNLRLKNKFFDTLAPGTEIAIGGGAVTTHPQLEAFLMLLKNKGIIANMTINERELFTNMDFVISLLNKKLVNGLGISYVEGYNHAYLNNILNVSDNIVIHLIAGIADKWTFKDLRDKNRKILILGYKEFRNGIAYHSKNYETIDQNIAWLKENLKDLIDEGAFDTISFDNLAIKQLDVESAMSSDIFKKMYMGDDGQFTMYIDLPNNQYAFSSIAPLNKRYEIVDDIKEMFKNVSSDTTGTEDLELNGKPKG